MVMRNFKTTKILFNQRLCSEPGEVCPLPSIIYDGSMGSVLLQVKGVDDPHDGSLTRVNHREENLKIINK